MILEFNIPLSRGRYDFPNAFSLGVQSDSAFSQGILQVVWVFLEFWRQWAFRCTLLNVDFFWVWFLIVLAWMHSMIPRKSARLQNSPEFDRNTRCLHWTRKLWFQTLYDMCLMTWRICCLITSEMLLTLRLQPYGLTMTGCLTEGFSNGIARFGYLRRMVIVKLE